MFISYVQQIVDQNIQNDVFNWSEIMIVAIPNIALISVAIIKNNRQHKLVEEKLESKIGTPNGHGTLIQQVTDMYENQMKVSGSVSDIQLRLTSHMQQEMDQREVTNKKIDKLGERIDAQGERIDRLVSEREISK